MPIEADITHAHLGVPTALALVEIGIERLVVTEHQSTLHQVFAQAGAREAYRSVVLSADAFLCVSEHLRQEVLEAIGDDVSDKIGVLPNIVDLANIAFQPERDPPGSHWLYVGTVAFHKGIELLLKSFKLWRKSVVKDAMLTIVGDGPHMAWVERFVSDHGLQEAVRLAGAIAPGRVGDFLGQADVMVHLSPAETFGIATLEAIGAGLPVISLRNGGAESTWGEVVECVGRLLPLDTTPSDVVGAVEDLRAKRHRLDAGAARLFVDERFSPWAIAEQLVGIYERCA